MKKTIQKQLKELARTGQAQNITNADETTINRLYYSCDRVAVSTGIYGINGGLIQDRETGAQFVIIGRCSNLFRIF